MTSSANSTHILPSSIRAFIIASSYWLLTVALTSAVGSGSAFIGCLLACFAIDKFIARQPLRQLRTSIIALAAALLVIAGILVSQLVTASVLIASWLGPIATFELGEAIQWTLLAFALTALLRSIAQRTSYGRILEILFVATAFVITLAAHRQGMIHRPFFIGDFALSRGIDPSSILMALGSAAVLSLAGLLIAEGDHRRLPYHFTMLALLCFSLLVYIQLYGLPTPQLTDGMGLTGQEGQAGAPDNDNPFRDSENDASDKKAPVAIVLFRDDYEPDSGSYYFRESAYTQFNGTMLVTTDRTDIDSDLIEGFPPSRVEIEEPLLALDKRDSVRTTIGLLAPHKYPFGLDSPVAYENTPNPNSLRFKRTYDAYSMVPRYNFSDLVGRSSGHPDWTQQQRETYLELPDDPRYRELAQSIIDDLRPEYADDPYAKALAIKEYLDRNGIYSLKNEHAYAEDPPASFLFGNLTGYCMHFSFAATYMLRSVGVPARVGIGYLVPAANRAGGSSLLIQAINGHAWPEVYLEGIGWVIVDPAPAQTLVDMSVDPQNSLQQLLGDMLRDEASFEDFIASQQDSQFPFALIGRVMLALIVGLLLSAYIVKAYRLRAPYWARNTQSYFLSYRASLDTLCALGVMRRYGESRESFAHRVAELSPSFATLSRSHLAQSLGGGLTLNEANNSIALHNQVKQELAQRLPLYKRVLAFIRPLSWTRTH